MSRDLALGLSGVVAVVLVALGLAYYGVVVVRGNRELENQAADLAERLAEVISVPLWDLDQRAIGQIADAYYQIQDVVAVRVLSADRDLVYEQVAENEFNLITASHPVMYNTELLGVVEVSLSQQDVRATRINVFGTVVVGILLVIFAVVVVTAMMLERRVSQPLSRMIEGISIIASGDYHYQLAPVDQVDVNAIIEQINAMARQIAERDRELERQVAERTRGLQMAAEVAHASSSELDLGQLLDQVVQLVRDRFDLYYVGLFLLDEGRAYAELHAGTGAAGRVMLEREHKLEFGGESMIGQCVVDGQVRIAFDVGAEEHRFDNPLLPDTRSEMALPLLSRGRVIGAMSVQSTQETAFGDADIALMQTVGDQVAVAIDNARLFATTQAALEEMEKTQQRYLGQAWSELLQRRSVRGYKLTRDEMVPLESDSLLPEVRAALARGGAVQKTDDEAQEEALFALPIVQRERPIGVLGVRRGVGQLDRNQAALVQTVAEQFSLAAENLRLLDETQQRASREQVVGTFTAQVRESLEMNVVLQRAVRELRSALNAPEVEIHLNPELSGRTAVAPGAVDVTSGTPDVTPVDVEEGE